MTKKYNEVLMNGIEKNLNRLYEGPFQSDIAQDRAAHFEIMDSCDVVFNNISKGLEAMDELRFTIDDDQVRRRAGVRVPAGEGEISLKEYLLQRRWWQVSSLLALELFHNSLIIEFVFPNSIVISKFSEGLGRA